VDLQRIIDEVERLAVESDPEMAPRVLIVYLAANDAGLYVHRVQRGTHQLGGETNFQESMSGAVEKLWPESSTKTRQWLRIAADFIAHSPIARMLGKRPTDGE